MTACYTVAVRPGGRQSFHAIALASAFIFVPLTASDALAQSEAPVPPEPSQGKPPVEKKSGKTKRRPVEPGFGAPVEEEAPPAAEEEAPSPPAKKRGRSSGEEEEEEDYRRPVDVPDQGTNERLIDDLNAATGEVTLNELIDEILADVVAELDQRPAKLFSPLAIRHVQIGKNIQPGYARKLQVAIVAQVHAGTDIRILECVECEATRTQLVGNQWVISRGVSTTAEMRRIGESLGVKAFMDVAFGFQPDTGVLEMDFKVWRAKDSRILWADSFRADETTPMIVRSSDAPVKRKERMRDLEMLLEGRPLYGYVATAGFMILPHNDPIDGDIGGATAGYRIYERFGTERRVMFGLDLTGFLNTSRLSGAVISAGSWWIPLRPDLINPELRLGAKAGAFIAGTAGNAAVFQLGAEVLLRYRFGLYGYVLFMTKSAYPPNTTNELGGVGMATGMSFNW